MGNYDMRGNQRTIGFVIPLREKTGNYDEQPETYKRIYVIPLREKMGNNDNVSAPNIP